MSVERVHIKRYPNRRYYARQLSKYVSLNEIEDMIQAGQTIEVHDSQSGEDLTRSVLAQIIVERHPDKMELFPTDMLHFILRSNDAMSSFLRDYFRHSITYLEYLHRHGGSPSLVNQPTHWLKAWLDCLTPNTTEDAAADSTSSDDPLVERVNQLDQRLRHLESRND